MGKNEKEFDEFLKDIGDKPDVESIPVDVMQCSFLEYQTRMLCKIVDELHEIKHLLSSDDLK